MGGGLCVTGRWAKQRQPIFRPVLPVPFTHKRLPLFVSLSLSLSMQASPEVQRFQQYLAAMQRTHTSEPSHIPKLHVEPMTLVSQLRNKHIYDRTWDPQRRAAVAALAGVRDGAVPDPLLTTTFYSPQLFRTTPRPQRTLRRTRRVAPSTPGCPGAAGGQCQAWGADSCVCPPRRSSVSARSAPAAQRGARSPKATSMASTRSHALSQSASAPGAPFKRSSPKHRSGLRKLLARVQGLRSQLADVGGNLQRLTHRSQRRRP